MRLRDYFWAWFFCVYLYIIIFKGVVANPLKGVKYE